MNEEPRSAGTPEELDSARARRLYHAGLETSRIEDSGDERWNRAHSAALQAGASNEEADAVATVVQWGFCVAPLPAGRPLSIIEMIKWGAFEATPR